MLNRSERYHRIRSRLDLPTALLLCVGVFLAIAAVNCTIGETPTPTTTPTPTPPVVTPTATPPMVTPTPTPPVSTPTATPPVSTPTATPPMVSPTATPPVVTPTATPPVVTPTATPPVVTPTAKPLETLRWDTKNGRPVIDRDGKYWEKYHEGPGLVGVYLRLKDRSEFVKAFDQYLELKEDNTFERTEGGTTTSGTWRNDEDEIFLTAS